MNKTAIQKAVEAAGGQTALAKLIGVSQGLVWQWCDGRLAVRAEHCASIERVVGGEVSRYDLRPDVFGPAPKREGEAA